MVIRSKISGRTTVHAGPADGLAALALEYAAGEHGTVPGAQPCHFENVAARLREGYGEESAGTVLFWADRADGSPFRGPDGYRPPPPSAPDVAARPPSP